eukprot:9496911-Pyramimonas_sp.AAC.1
MLPWLHKSAGSTIRLCPKPRRSQKATSEVRRLLLHNLSMWGHKATKLFAESNVDIIIMPETHVLACDTQDILSTLKQHKWQ